VPWPVPGYDAVVLSRYGIEAAILLVASAAGCAVLIPIVWRVVSLLLGPLSDLLGGR